jgi:hypothetical protein
MNDVHGLRSRKPTVRHCVIYINRAYNATHSNNTLILLNDECLRKMVKLLRLQCFSLTKSCSFRRQRERGIFSLHYFQKCKFALKDEIVWTFGNQLQKLR